MFWNQASQIKLTSRFTVFWGDFYPNLDGFTSIKEPAIDLFRTYMPNVASFTNCGQRPPESVFCTGRIKHVGSAFVDQWTFLKTVVPSDMLRGCKITMPAPELYHFRYKEGKAYPKDVYKNDEKFFAAIAEAYRTEIQILYDNGVRNIQIDDPNLACRYSLHSLDQLTRLTWFRRFL